jgi:hypothetical protein
MCRELCFFRERTTHHISLTKPEDLYFERSLLILRTCECVHACVRNTELLKVKEVQLT